MIIRGGTVFLGLCISAVVGSVGTAATELACGDRVTASVTLDRDFDCTADGLQVVGNVSGCTVYAWNGRADPSENGTSIGGRYQTAVVRLGTPCLP